MKIWGRALKNHQWANGDYAQDDIDSALEPDSLRDIIARFGANTKPVFIFDEFDRITDRRTKTQMAETIKLFSDRLLDTTIIIAGVGRTVRDLIAQHKSLPRALKQVYMPRMSGDEIGQIVNVRLARGGMQIDARALETLIWLARGMPGYAHLLGKYTAKSAINAKRLEIKSVDIFRSVETCLEEVEESTKHAYLLAVQSGKANLLMETLLACAIVDDQDELGRFPAAAVADPLEKILKKERSIPHYQRHLDAFCGARGPVLEKDGTPKNYRYRFIDPMMQSYVIMKGLKAGLLPGQEEDQE